jgi:hypothetical protein
MQLPRWILTPSAPCMVIVLLACDPSAPPDPTGLPRPNASSQGVVQSATGSGHFESGGELRTFAFSAVQRADGTVQGEWQVVSRVGAGTKLHGDVVCVSVLGNRAWVGTRIESSDNPVVVIGSEGGFRVVDNGEGNDPPDQTSVAFFNGPAGFAQNYCNNRPAAPPLNAVLNGNIQVRE